MIKDAEDFAEEDKKVAERAVAKVCNLYIGLFPWNLKISKIESWAKIK